MLNEEKLLEQVAFITSSKSDREDELLRICELLKNKVYHYDWVGFYLLDTETQTLKLGPFAGKPTEHIEIPVGKGVCGQVAQSGKTMVVQDVSKIDNYIACSLDVQSEIVVPILKDGKFVAEIDIDSHSPAPFTTEDEIFLTSVCEQVAHLF